MNSGLLCAKAHCGASRSIAIKAARYQRFVCIGPSMVGPEILSAEVSEGKVAAGHRTRGVPERVAA